MFRFFFFWIMVFEEFGLVWFSPFLESVILGVESRVSLFGVWSQWHAWPWRDDGPGRRVLYFMSGSGFLDGSGMSRVCRKIHFCLDFFVFVSSLAER
jgi:hypothetical protein